MDFSFILPVYNCKAYLPDCVDSILAVGVPGCEILLVDDGSTDGSGALCDELAQKNPCIRVIHQANAGASAARNAGLDAAVGEHVLFVDADDGLDSQALNSILSDQRCLQSDLTVFGLTFDYYHHGKLYRRDPIYYETDGILPADLWESDIVTLYLKNSLSAMWNKVYKRSILEDNHLRLNTDMFLYEDLEFVLRYLACCGDIWNVPQAVYHYRQSEDEGNAGRRLSRIESIPTLLAYIEDALASLRAAHPGVAEDDCQNILQTLHQVLAREKITVSNLEGVRKICREYAQWEKTHISSPAPSKFRDRLVGEKAAALLISRELSALRHRAAVTVKSALRRIRGNASC